jgi:hypothetical protein
MQERKKTGLDSFDWLLVGMIVAVLFAGVFLLLQSPTWWGWCLRILDTRNWSNRAWTGAGIALLGVLFLIRVWPEGRLCGAERNSTTILTPGDPDASERGDASVPDSLSADRQCE